MHSMVGIENVSVFFPSDPLDGLSKKFVCVELINRVKVFTNHNGKRHPLTVISC